MPTDAYGIQYFHLQIVRLVVNLGSKINKLFGFILIMGSNHACILTILPQNFRTQMLNL